MKRVLSIKETIGNKRFYAIGEMKVPSVTTILDLAYQKEWMRPWLARKMAQEAASGVSSSEKDFLDSIKRSTREASEHGDEIHKRFGDLSTGKSPDFPPLEQWQQTYSPEILYSEAVVANPTMFYAGTLDMVARIGNKTYLIDLKTGMHLDSSIKLQLAAYKNCEIIVGGWSSTFLPQKMPHIDACAILWIPRNTPEEWTFREVSVGNRELQAFLSCVNVANYHIANSDMNILGKIVSYG